MQRLEVPSRRHVGPEPQRRAHRHEREPERAARVAERLANDTSEEGFGAGAFRDASGIGRNVTIELLEYFDRVGLTRRVGNVRFARRSADALIAEYWTNEG